MAFFDFIYWNHDFDLILLLNIAIVIGLFTSLRLFSGTIAHISASDELIRKDNPAFGVSLAGVVLGVALVLSGAIFGNPINDMMGSAIAIGLYGVIGIVLMALTRIIFDKIALPNISIRDEIVKSNTAAGIVDAGNVVATAIIIRAVMTWITSNTVEGLVALLAGYVIGQTMLTVTTYLRAKVYALRTDGGSISEDLKTGNVAVALRFAGRKIGTAFAITAAANLMVYDVQDIHILLAAWGVIALVMIVLLVVLTALADKVILFGTDVTKEVVKEKNIAIGIVQAVIYISLGFLLAEFIA